MVKIGIGYDVHPLAEGETLIIGGMKIDSTIGSVGHSDGDVLLHTIGFSKGSMNAFLIIR